MSRDKDLSIIIPNRREKKIGDMLRVTRSLYPNAQIIISEDDKGLGKGITLQRGLWKADRDIIVFINGDMDIYPSQIDNLLDHINYYDIVIGVKDISAYPLHRKIISQLSRYFIRKMFNLPVKDTQTGIKVFKRYALHNWDTWGYACDIEILAQAHKRGYKIKEVEVTASSTKGKGLKILWKTFWEAVRIKRRLK